MKLIDKKTFKSLTAAQKRVEIAKDVLLRIKKKMVSPTVGQFFTNLDDVIGGLDWKDSVQEAINNSQCEVCAKGALVCSWVGNFNRVKKKDVVGFDIDLRYEDSFPKSLVKLFGRDMLDCIENNFEGMDYGWASKEASKRGIHPKYCGNLAAIMKNIIKNNGTFIP